MIVRVTDDNFHDQNFSIFIGIKYFFQKTSTLHVFPIHTLHLHRLPFSLVLFIEMHSAIEKYHHLDNILNIIWNNSFM